MHAISHNNTTGNWLNVVADLCVYIFMHADVSVIGHSVDRKFQSCGKLAWLISTMFPITYSCHHILLIHTHLNAGSCQERLCAQNIHQSQCDRV